MKKLEELMQQLGYQFHDTQLFITALTHRSVSEINNERLEFLGDSILDFVVADLLYKKYPKLHEGELSRLRATLVKGETLAELANEYNIGDHILLGVGERKSGGAYRKSILADAFEAIIAAIYIDGGLDICYQMITHWYESRLESIHYSDDIKDAKTRLQEFLQANHLPLPKYTIAKTQGKEHAQTFFINCGVDGIEFVSEGKGTSRRRAEQEAAADFLERLQHGE